ncbi:MAG: serine hydrolase domain-containing protein [Methylovirgula sp.]|uniref:serine hydrolase domain-containing protein n=1 Tax=Methylovirgula sp. TaxID=1978224 RepID=UPI003076232E
MPDYAESAAKIIAPFVEADLFAGSILVAQNGAPRLRQGFGLANREWNVPHSVTGKFRLGSLTKQFTATAILQLMERGRLALDDKVARHFPNAPAAWADVCLFHLLTHASGIPSYTSLPHFFAQDGRRDHSPRELIALTETMPLDFPPGSAFKYNNGGYVILGHVIEHLTGRSYEAYVRENILEPLGLRNTGYEHVEAIIPERVPGYRLRNGQIENAGFLAMSVPHAAGAIYSTLDDLLAWQRALVAAKPFSPASAALMFKDHGHGYGFGWGIQSQFGRRQFVHAGGINGFSVVVSFYPDDDLFIAILANIQAAPVQKIARDLAALHFGVTEPMPSLVLDAALLADYVGTYRLASGRTLRIMQEGARLFAETGDYAQQELVATDDQTFAARLVDWHLRFAADGVEQAQSVVLVRDGMEMSGTREG